MRRWHLSFLLSIFLMTGCTSGAVVFAPTPAPPDLSPLLYQHPGGAFSLQIPRNWSVYVQNLSTLAAAAFAPPDADEPLLAVSVINLGEPLDTNTFAAFIDQYQSQIRPDMGRYTEQNQQAMGDGSWRITGLRQTTGGTTQALNTFIERSGAFVAVIEVVLPADPGQQAALQTILNTFRIHETASLAAASISTLTFASETRLEVLHVATWTTPEGVFFITGEVANYSGEAVANLPVRAVLRTHDDLAVAEAVDVVMGHSLPPGGFAPFSLRFGQGQPAMTGTYELFVGGEAWQPAPVGQVYGQESLAWTDESEIDGRQLIISGTVSNTSGDTIRALQVVVTVFDAAQNVIAAGFSPLAVPQLAPGESADFQHIIAEMGGQPANYIVTIQGLP